MDDTDRTLRVGAAQVAEVYLDREATVEKDCEFVAEAGERGLDLLVFPEFHVPSRPTWYRFVEDVEFEEYYKRLFDEAVTVPGPATDRLCAAAAEAEVALVVGVTEKAPDTAGTMYNTLVFVDADGTLVGSRRKLVPTIDERLFHTGGTGEDVRTFETSLGTIGGLMCGEHTNQLAKFATLAQGEAVHAGAWPAFPYWDREKREAFVGSVSREHAIAGGVPVVAATGVLTDELAASVGIEDMSRDSGTSMVVAPDGTTLAGPMWEGEGILEAEVDQGDRVRAKAFHDTLGHYNRFDVFELTVDRSAREPVRFVGDREQGSDAPGDG